MNLQRPFCLSIVVVCWLLGGVQAQQPQPATPKAEPASIETQAPQPYLLGPGDLLEVTVDQLTSPTKRVQVDGDRKESSTLAIAP